MFYQAFVLYVWRSAADPSKVFYKLHLYIIKCNVTMELDIVSKQLLYLRRNELDVTLGGLQSAR